jgi:hypothetical protein
MNTDIVLRGLVNFLLAFLKNVFRPELSFFRFAADESDEVGDPAEADDADDSGGSVVSPRC